MSKPVEIEVYTLAKYKDKTCNLQELLEYLYNENQKKDNIINKAIHRIQLIQMDGEVSIKDLTKLVNILKGSDKE